jgi:hypothetical protein
VNTLHVLDEPVREVATASDPVSHAERPSFRALLMKSLGK